MWRAHALTYVVDRALSHALSARRTKALGSRAGRRDRVRLRERMTTMSAVTSTIARGTAANRTDGTLEE